MFCRKIIMFSSMKYQIQKLNLNVGKIREKAIREMQARGVKSELRSNDESGLGDGGERYTKGWVWYFLSIT